MALLNKVAECALADGHVFKGGHVVDATVLNYTVGPVTSRSPKKGLFLIGFNAVTRLAIYILGHKVDLIRNVTLSRFRIFAVKFTLLPFLDLIDVFEECIVSFWAIKLTF